MLWLPDTVTFWCQDRDFQRHMQWSFCVHWVQLRWEVIICFWFCWFWWNWWPSLFKLSFHTYSESYLGAVMVLIIKLTTIRPCKINYLVLRYRRVGKKSAAGLYLSPNKNKYNGKKVRVQIFAPLSKRDNSNFTLKEFGTLLCFPLIVRSRYFR